MSYHVGSLYLMMSRHAEPSLETSRLLPECVRQAVTQSRYSFFVLPYDTTLIFVIRHTPTPLFFFAMAKIIINSSYNTIDESGHGSAERRARDNMVNVKYSLSHLNQCPEGCGHRTVRGAAELLDLEACAARAKRACARSVLSARRTTSPRD